MMPRWWREVAGHLRLATRLIPSCSQGPPELQRAAPRRALADAETLHAGPPPASAHATPACSLSWRQRRQATGPSPTQQRLPIRAPARSHSVPAAPAARCAPWPSPAQTPAPAFGGSSWRRPGYCTPGPAAGSAGTQVQRRSQAAVGRHSRVAGSRRMQARHLTPSSHLPRASWCATRGALRRGGWAAWPRAHLQPLHALRPQLLLEELWPQLQAAQSPAQAGGEAQVSERAATASAAVAQHCAADPSS